MELCLLDSKAKHFMDIVLSILQICLDFRELCQVYLLRKPAETKQDNREMEEMDADGDLGLSEESDKQDEDDIIEGIEKYGKGQLRIESAKFMEKVGQCKTELQVLIDKFNSRMRMLIVGLHKIKTKGPCVYSYFNEAFIRFNFNSFYFSRDEEGLD